MPQFSLLLRVILVIIIIEQNALLGYYLGVLILTSVCLQGIICRSQRAEHDTKGNHLVSVFCMRALAKHFILEDF